MALEFNEEIHQYTLDGEVLISVTQLMRQMGLAPNYSNVNPEVLKAKAEYGTLVHEEIEKWIKENEVGFSWELGMFQEFVKENKLQITHSEYQVHNDVVAGTVDLTYFCNGHNYISDFKTTYELHLESVKWQLSIYRYLINDGVDYDMATVMWFNQKEHQMEVIPVELVDKETIGELIKCYKENKSFNEYLLKKTSTNALIENACEVARKIKFFAETLDELNKQKSQFHSAILQRMQIENIDTLSSPDNTVKFTRVKASERTTIDSKKLKEERPEIYDLYSRKSMVSESLKVTIK